MNKPPRKKDEPIITQRLLYRVLFSAAIIVVGTLFIYKFALSDDHMSRREQTMVSIYPSHSGTLSNSSSSTDLHVFCLSRSGISNTKPGTRVRLNTKQNAGYNSIHILPGAAHPHLRPIHASDLPNGSATVARPFHITGHSWDIHVSTWRPTTIWTVSKCICALCCRRDGMKDLNYNTTYNLLWLVLARLLHVPRSNSTGAYIVNLKLHHQSGEP